MEVVENMTASHKSIVIPQGSFAHAVSNECGGICFFAIHKIICT